MNPDSTEKWKRKRLIVLPALQVRIIKACTLVPLAALAFSVTLVSLAWRQVMDETAQLDLDLASIGFLLVAFATLVAIATVVILLQSVVFSNRIAGPVYRMQKVLQAVREGDLSARAGLRDKDLLRELAAEMNLTLATLEHRLATSQPSEDRATAAGG